jgi:hypothetical protein
MPPTTDEHAPALIPTLHNASADVPHMETRAVSVQATLTVDTYAAVRVEPRLGETSLGDLPRRAHEAYCAWLDGLRSLGILIVGIDATIDIGASAPAPRPVLAAADIDRLRAGMRDAVAGTQAGPDDLVIHARRDEANWCCYGLAEMLEDRRERVADLLEDHVKRILGWLEHSPGCALLIPDVAER